MAHGADKFGDFVLEASTCRVCGKDATCVHYESFSAMGYDSQGAIDPKRLLAWHEGYIAAVGVECGCYGRLHRQVAHIVTTQKYARR